MALVKRSGLFIYFCDLLILCGIANWSGLDSDTKDDLIDRLLKVIHKSLDFWNINFFETTDNSVYVYVQSNYIFPCIRYTLYHVHVEFTLYTCILNFCSWFWKNILQNIVFFVSVNAFKKLIFYPRRSIKGILIITVVLNFRPDEHPLWREWTIEARLRRRPWIFNVPSIVPAERQSLQTACMQTSTVHCSACSWKFQTEPLVKQFFWKLIQLRTDCSCTR